MRICFISHSSSKLGAERSLLEMVDALREHGVECYVILPSYGPLSKELQLRGITNCNLPFKWWASNAPTLWHRVKTTLLNVFCTMIVAIKLKIWKCNIVLSNTTVICVGAFAAKLLRLPHVWYIREYGFEHLGYSFHLGENVSLKLVDRLSHVCIANSNVVAQKFRDYIIPFKLKVLYQSVMVNPVSNNDYQIGKASEMQCIIIGGVQEGKRQEDAIRAIAELVERGMRIELIILGDGNWAYQDYLKNIIIDNKLENQIEFVGTVDNAFPYIEKADVVLVCSRCEAFGRVTIEAMKAAKPVIGARSGGTPELIQEGFNGLLYNLMDYKDLADKIAYLYKNPEIRQQMGKNGQQWATERFNQAHYGHDLLNILAPLIKDKNSNKV